MYSSSKHIVACVSDNSFKSCAVWKLADLCIERPELCSLGSRKKKKTKLRMVDAPIAVFV